MKNPTDNNQQGSQKTTQKSYSSTLSAQRERILTRLKIEPLSTIQARHELDILAPAARVFELRHSYGYNIFTLWLSQETPCGNLHRVALYILLAGKYERGAKQ